MLLLKSACIFEMIIDMNKSQHEMDVASLWLPIDTKIQTVSEVSNVYFSCYKKEFLVSCPESSGKIGHGSLSLRRASGAESKYKQNGGKISRFVAESFYLRRS